MRNISKAALLLTLMIFVGFANAEVDPELLERATQGDASAQYSLGLKYATGTGVPEDHKDAAKWYRLAAEQGEADSQFNLGLMYDYGEGVPKDDKEASEVVPTGSLSKEVLSARVLLGLKYDFGKGVPKDDKEAVKWYRLGADQGNASAQSNLGRKYATGTGVPEDHKKAVKWYRLAA